MSDSNNYDDEYVPEFHFDKFIDDIVKREDQSREDIKRYVDEHADSPQREYNRLYRERPQNRVVWRPKKQD
tara:strand:+ start:914 stop:1126 length:213 start_codon:yes stop_codon:yes gene_type:complete